MIVSTQPPVHLTYCLNVHPGETWAENFAAIRDKAMSVRRRVAPNQRFGLGLRLGRLAAGELAVPSAMAAFREFLGDHDLYAFTVNGFPYGQFHGTSVKQDVYRPDWTHPERRDYTNLLAEVLCFLLPNGVDGSISTLPVSYGGWIRNDEQLAQACRMLADCAAFADSLYQASGKTVRLAVEPEADCYVERTEQLVEFLTGPLQKFGGEHLQKQHGRSAADAQAILCNHIGACVDTAHCAVQFESPHEALDKLRHAELAVPKVQLSAALSAEPSPEVLDRLKAFCDPVYLHQTKVRRDSGEILSYPDLADALASQQARGRGNQWRIHFHVPLFFDSHMGLCSTSRELVGPFAAALPHATTHAEIETYTLTVLPEFLRPADMVDAIAKEYEWVLRNVFERV